MEAGKWMFIPALVAPAAVCTPVFAVQYLTVEQAQKALFPQAARFIQSDVTITPEIRRRIEQSSGLRVRNPVQRVWRVELQDQPAGWFILDEVVGKHEFITYAAALNANGSVRGIEIMDYRESYGYQIRNTDWRRQFAGKTANDPFKLDQDIRNISGATLSCRNVTDGVKRLLALYDAALK